MMPKFRVWDRNREEMLYSDCDDPNKLLINWDFRNNAWLATRAKDGFVLGKHNADLMYYTGLKETYRGDIVGFIDDDCNGVVFQRKDGCWMIRWCDGSVTPLISAVRRKDFIIKGNIYENPELLKEEKNE